MSRLVVDASVAIKWALPEDGSELAEQLATGGAELHAPAFIFLELANLLRKRMRAHALAEDDARDLLAHLRCAPLMLWPGEEPLPAALTLARTLDHHAVYDCAYLALALHLDAVYVTADLRFWRKAQNRAEVADRVLRLADLAEPG